MYYMLLIFYKLLGLLLKYRPLCAVSFITSANLWTGITCNITGTPYIVSERTSPNRTINQFNYINNQLAALIYKKSTAVVVSAQAVEDCIRENKAFKNLANIKQITNAVPVFEPVSSTKVHNRKFILGVGRLDYVKGFDQLILAFNETKMNDVDLLITGDGPERANLICLVYNLGLRDRVIFAGAKTNLQDYYSQATMFVLPSRNEGYPNALVEAMSFGCPCVAMNCEFGPSEIINNEQNGLLVSNADISALSDAIIRLANDPVLSSTLGNNAKNINQTNSSQKILKQWDSLILKHYSSSAFN
jgi:glycosyltransferase involved in cell wall biosynthesis